jgi:hypothetical protein
MKDMNNIINYSIGFTEGIERGKTEFLKTMGDEVTEIASQFIDTNARVSPETLHHVYEWYKTGSPDARLFDINYTVSNLGLSFISKFKQSTTIKQGSNVPFRDKAFIARKRRTVEFGTNTVFNTDSLANQSPKKLKN